MKLLRMAVVVVSLVAFQSYSQDEFPKSLFSKADAGTTNTVTVGVSGYDVNVVGKLKDDLSAFEEKIESVSFDEDNKELIVVYNEYMIVEDIIRLFELHKVDHRKREFSISTTNPSRQ